MCCAGAQLRRERLRAPLAELVVRGVDGDGVEVGIRERRAPDWLEALWLELSPREAQLRQRARLAHKLRELVRRAVQLRSCEASGVTLHTLREVLRVLPAEIVSLAPAVRGSPNSCSHTELASLLCFGPGDPAQLLTELKIAWDAVKEPRPQYDQLQMRAVQWLWLWVRGCGVTNLGRLADLVRAGVGDGDRGPVPIPASPLRSLA